MNPVRMEVLEIQIHSAAPRGDLVVTVGHLLPPELGAPFEMGHLSSGGTAGKHSPPVVSQECAGVPACTLSLPWSVGHGVGQFPAVSFRHLWQCKHLPSPGERFFPTRVEQLPKEGPLAGWTAFLSWLWWWRERDGLASLLQERGWTPALRTDMCAWGRGGTQPLGLWPHLQLRCLKTCTARTSRLNFSLFMKRLLRRAGGNQPVCYRCLLS